MKFKVGDRVKYLDAIVTIKEVTIQDPLPYLVGYIPGHEWRCSEVDIELIQPEAPKAPDPKGPIPGKFYRTRDGEKIMFVGLAIDGEYFYQDTSLEIRGYSLPFTYTDDGFTDGSDIVGEWVDVLPAAEIKRWAIFSRKDNYVLKYFDSEADAKNAQLVGNLEVVELVGILPPRNAGK
jgi:hypothetical protein